MPSEMSYLLFLSSPCQNRRMAECSLPESQELCVEITVLARIAELRDRRMFGNINSSNCQSNLPFCGDKIQPKPDRGVPQASHGTRCTNIPKRSPTAIQRPGHQADKCKMVYFKKTIYKITKIVRTLWLAERRGCMRVCNHGCDVTLSVSPAHFKAVSLTLKYKY